MIVRDKIYIDTAELGSRITDLCELFTHRNPEFFEKKKLKLSVKGVNPYLFHYILSRTSGGQTLCLPRGSLKKVKEFYERNGLVFKVLDNRISHKEININLVDTVLESQQDNVINSLYNNEGGLIEAPPAMGKTISILGLIAKVKQPTLILVHEFRLSDQWFFEIKKRLKGEYKLGILNGERKEDGDIVIAIINTAYNIYQEDSLYFNKFGMVIIDETHRLPSQMFMKVVNNMPAKWRIGVSGTLKRKDKKEFLMFETIGECLLSIKTNELKHRITDFEYIFVNTNVPYVVPSVSRWTGAKREKALDIVNAITELTKLDKRNDLIIENIVGCIEEGYFPLVLSDRVNHNKMIYERIKSLGYKTILIIGKGKSKSVNWEDIRKDESIQCIVATTSIASEGLDLPRLSALHLTCPSSNEPKTKQRVGRIRRICDNKPLPRIFDYVDNLSYFEDEKGNRFNLFMKMAKKREKVYVKLTREYNDEN
jgi:superfamily II DNA or RNA helicase